MLLVCVQTCCSKEAGCRWRVSGTTQTSRTRLFPSLPSGTALWMPWARPALQSLASSSTPAPCWTNISVWVVPESCNCLKCSCQYFFSFASEQVTHMFLWMFLWSVDKFQERQQNKAFILLSKINCINKLPFVLLIRQSSVVVFLSPFAGAPEREDVIPVTTVWAAGNISLLSADSTPHCHPRGLHVCLWVCRCHCPGWVIFSVITSVSN